MTSLATALVWPDPDPYLEAVGSPNSPASRVQMANRAAAQVGNDRNKVERSAAEQLLIRLRKLRDTLQARLVPSLTDFRRYTISQLLADTDRMIEDTERAISLNLSQSMDQMGNLGTAFADEPIRAARLNVQAGLPGLDPALVTAAFGNAVDLLTEPMRQYGTIVKSRIRAVALAGDNRMDAIQQLQKAIQGGGFDSAAYKAERIIRTEIGRVFNAATYARMVGLAQQFPFLRKGWRATNDGRTRLGHREAGQKYVRGQGIPIAGGFLVNVYQEGKGQAPKLKGKVAMRFPIDPEATPAGQLAASATIMCRCNAFVDFNLSEFAQYTQARVQTIVPGAPPAPPPPKAAPVAVPPPVKKPRAPRKPKPMVQPVPVLPIPPTPMVAPEPTATTPTPGGTPISLSIKIKRGWDFAQQAFNVLDKVLGDGDNLTKIALNLSRAQGFYGRFTSRGSFFGSANHALKMDISVTGKASHPLNTLWHETGHWVDLEGLAKTFPGAAGTFTSELDGHPALRKYWEVVRNSRAIQALKKSADEGTYKIGTGKSGTGSEIYVGRQQVRYYLRRREIWARTFSQYVANKAAALADAGGLAAFSPQEIQALRKGKWELDNRYDEAFSQWDDEDFKDIEQAMDDLFAELGWRIPAGTPIPKTASGKPAPGGP
jgi:hypothetical protein